jgi:FtsH-binding integral membrane protein
MIIKIIKIKLKEKKMNENNTEVYPKMFTWLFIGLLITFASGYALSQNLSLLSQILSIGIIPIIVIELVIAIVLSIRLAKMNPLTMKILYVVYCIVTGITFATLFIVYELTSMIGIFMITAIIFGLLALYGYTTKRDLTKLGTILLIALIGTIIGELLNMLIFRNASLNLGITVLGVFIFVAYIAYDVNKVKDLVLYAGEDRAAVYGAFSLYLDFINLFVRLLELFGKRND